jgi:hypothetical protein
MKSVFQLLLPTILFSCLADTSNRHLDERTFTSGDITVKWYRTSDITTIHDFIEVERWGWKRTLMEANTDGIYDVLINRDTVRIQITKGTLVYTLAAKTLNCYVKLDSSITPCQYMKKYVPKNAKYHCDTDSSNMKITIRAPCSSKE